MMLVVGLSLSVTPAAVRLGQLFVNWWERGHQLEVGDLHSTIGPEQIDGHVVIAGFVRAGQLLAPILTAQNIRYIALESDARLVGALHAQGMPVYFGDAARGALLHKLHANRAAAIVLTIDHVSFALHALLAIRRKCPRVPFFARSLDEKHALALRKAGATMVFRETLASSVQLPALVVHTPGMMEDTASRIVQSELDHRISELHNNVST